MSKYMLNNAKKYAAVLLLVIPLIVFYISYLKIPPHYSYHVKQEIIHTLKRSDGRNITQSFQNFLHPTVEGNKSATDILFNKTSKSLLLKYIQKCQQTRKKAVIIYAPTRSGSTFLGEFFNQHSSVYYLFEPLHSVGYHKTNTTAIQQIVMKDLFLCNYSRIPKFYKDLPNDRWSKCNSNLCYSSRSKFLWRNTHLCPHDPPYCGVEKFDPQKLEQICQQSLFTAIKVISLTSLSSLVPLLSDPQLDLKVIQLVRDPRAVVPSQMRMNRDNSSTALEKYTTQLCAHYHNDWLYHQQCIAGRNITVNTSTSFKYCNESTMALWKDRFMRLSHEFVSENPLRAMTIIYKFVGLNFDKNVENWIRLSTNDASNQSVWNDKSDATNGFYGTVRNSKNVLKKWRSEQSFSVIRYIENHCDKAMGELGYIPAMTIERLRNSSKTFYSTVKSVFLPLKNF